MNNESKKRLHAILALALLVPVPTIGVTSMLLVFEEGALGKAISLVCKIWIAALPVLWMVRIDGERPAVSKPTGKGMPAAVITGLLILTAILGAHELVQGHVDRDMMRAKAVETGLDNVWAFLGIFVYLILVNSLLEEYVWRWFVFRKLEVALPEGRFRGPLAVVGAAACFTIHHIIALAVWLDGPLVALASLGVFVGALTWSGLYLRYRSVWPCYVSHVFADVAVLIIGWRLIFAP